VKHVWILNHYAQEPGGAGGTRHFHLAEYLKVHGWQATIIAASVDHGTGLQRLNNDEQFRHETLRGVPFLWLRTPQYVGNGGGRISNMLAYTRQVLKKASTQALPRPDLIIGSSVHPFAAWAGARLARRHNVPFVFEVRDLWPQTLIDMGRLKESSPMTWGLRLLERWLYRQAARTIVLLPHAHEYIVPLGIPREKVVWIPNGVDLSLFPNPAAPAPSEDFTLMYFGAHGQANGLDNVLNAMNELQRQGGNEHIKLRLIGDGPLKPQLQQQAAALALRNVSFEPPVPKSQIPVLAAQADAFVFNLIDAPVLRYGISSNKLFDFLAAARPIIFSCDASNNPVQDAKAGITVKPGDPKALAEAVKQMASLSALDREQMGRFGRLYVEQNHSFDQLAQKLAQTLNTALESSSRNEAPV
jgi:glycosyltransferase involved in cell wall biosynthesis